MLTAAKSALFCYLENRKNVSVVGVVGGKRGGQKNEISVPFSSTTFVRNIFRSDKYLKTTVRGR